MNKFFFVVLLTTILLQTSLAQTVFKISSYKETPETFKHLLLSNSEISKNDTLNEEIIDLVEPMLLDSVIERRTQHHKVFMVGWFIHAFGGYNWRAVDMKKQKFVGTVTGHGRSGEVEYSEYDINYNLQFHLDKYLHKNFAAFDLQKKYHRQDIRRSHHTNYKVPPFVRDTNNIDSKQYQLHCELTPPHNFIPQLNYLFYPTLPGYGGTKEHINFGSEHPSMGFYGVVCLDCNHNCHPELHPYEMAWWLKATDEDQSHDKVWLVGIFHEGSNRMKRWSQNPMTGSIKIPFACKSDSTTTVKVEHLVFSKFENEGLKKVPMPQSTFSSKEQVAQLSFEVEKNLASNLSTDSVVNMELTLQGLNSQRFPLTVQFNNPLNTEGLKYWFSDLNLDEQNHIISGYFNLATSVKDLYTTRITFINRHD